MNISLRVKRRPPATSCAQLCTPAILHRLLLHRLYLTQVRVDRPDQLLELFLQRTLVFRAHSRRNRIGRHTDLLGMGLTLVAQLQARQFLAAPVDSPGRLVGASLQIKPFVLALDFSLSNLIVRD